MNHHGIFIQGVNVNVIATDKAPAAIGPYSQAVQTGNLLFCSGQIPLDPATGELVGGDVAAQTEQVMKNIAGLLGAAGLTTANIVKTTVFLTTMDDFSAMNEVYGKHLSAPQPARSTVAVVGLPRGVKVEIECIAEKSA